MLKHPIIFALFKKSITILPIKRAENSQNAGKLGVIVVFLHGKKTIYHRISFKKDIGYFTVFLLNVKNGEIL